MLEDRARGGRPIGTTEGAVVDARMVGELLSGTRDLAASVIAPGLGRAERLARAERATAAVQGVGVWQNALNPYRDPQHARLIDLLAASGHRSYQSVDPHEAADRLMLARAHDALALQARASYTDTAWTAGRADTLAPLVALPDACPLLDLAAPITYGEGPTQMVPGPWSDVPAAVIGFDTEMAATVPQLDEATARLIAARWVFNVALQDYAMAPGWAREYELLATNQVRTALETELVAVLVAAGVVAATLEAAECAIGAVWPAGASHVLVSGEDAPKVRRAYATDFPDPADRPTILPSAGVTTGTAVVFAAAGVRAEYTGVQWIVTEAPRVLGREVGAVGYGRASVRIPGAVQLVTVV